jgi:hypothetical protein
MLVLTTPSFLSILLLYTFATAVNLSALVIKLF